MRPSHAIYRLSPFAAIVLLCAICLRAAAISDFTGIYTSEKLTLALQADPASALRYTGTLTLGKTTYPCRGSFDPLAGFAGSFSSGSEQFSFSLIQDAQGFTLTSGGTQYALKRQAGAVGGGRSPLEPSPAAPTQPAGAGDHRIVEGKLPEYMKRGFQHPTKSKRKN